MNKFIAVGAAIMFFYGLAGAAQADEQQSNPRLPTMELSRIYCDGDNKNCTGVGEEKKADASQTQTASTNSCPHCANYDASQQQQCYDDCEKAQQSSGSGELQMAQPTGHGGFGGPRASSDNQQCQFECSEHINEDAYSACVNDCQAQNQSSNEQPTMIAQPTGHGGFGGPRASYGSSCVSRCNLHTTESGYKACMNDCDAQNQSSNKQPTMVADIRIGDPQPLCGTDPWACFNGTDESPDIRNVDIGIFGVFADGSDY